MDYKSATGRGEKRPASPPNSALPIHAFPDTKRFKAGVDNRSTVNTASRGPQTIRDFLEIPYQPLKFPSEIQSESRPVGAVTKSASNSWGWSDVKKVSKIESAKVSTDAYLEKFKQFFSLDLQDHPLASPCLDLPDIDLYICSERHLELYLHKSIIERVNTALQIIYDISQKSGNDPSLHDILPALDQRPVYTPGLHSGSSSKGSAIIPDLWCHSFFDPMQSNPPLLLGDIKLHQKWNSLYRQSEATFETRYRTGLAQLNFYIGTKKCAYSIILTEKEAVIVERVPGWNGWLRVLEPFTGQRDMSIALLGVCLQVSGSEPEQTNPNHLPEAAPNEFYPKEVPETLSSSLKTGQSTESYS